MSERKSEARPNPLIHLYVKTIDPASREFGVPVDEEGLAGGGAIYKIRRATGCV